MIAIDYSTQKGLKIVFFSDDCVDGHRFSTEKVVTPSGDRLSVELIESEWPVEVLAGSHSDGGVCNLLVVLVVAVIAS